jgi:hypothetical protein
VSHASAPFPTHAGALRCKIGHAVPVEYVSFALLLIGMAALWWTAYRMEPHWSSRDGRRFLCISQELPEGFSPGRRRETRVSVLDDGTLIVGQKRGIRRLQSTWTLEGRADTMETGRGARAIYVARERIDGKGGMRMTLRLPLKSRSVAVLDALLNEHD